MTDTITLRDVTLTPLPHGWVTGRVTDITGTRSLTASLSVLNAPVTITAHGVYSLALPIGTHVLRAQAGAHRIVTAEVTITAGQTVTQNFALPDAPTHLVSGQRTLVQRQRDSLLSPGVGRSQLPV